MGSMRIGYLVNEFPKISHSFIRREIEALERLGVEVEIFSIRPYAADLAEPADIAHAARTTILYGDSGDLAGAMRTETLTNGRFLISTTAAAMRFAKSSEKSAAHWSAYVAEAARLRQLAVELGVDHIHAHFGTNPAAVAMLCRLLGGPSYSFTVHGPEEFDRQIGLSLTEKIDLASFVVGISSFGRSQLLRLAPPSRHDDVHVVHCGLAPNFADGARQPIGESRRLVTVGRFSEQKGHWVLLDAARRVVGDGIDFQLDLIGDGELRPEIEAAISENGLESNVHLAGWATEAEVRDAIVDSRAMVLPSFAEGLPVVIMESLALGRPVVSTYVAGIPELVTPGECGWLVPAGDPASLAAAMRAVLAADGTDLDTMGDAGARRVALMHDVNTEAAHLADLFDDAIRRGQTRLSA